MTSIGARVPWTIIKEARRALIPEDSRFVEATWGLHDGQLFKLEGALVGASAKEIAQFAREIEWPAIPQRRVPQRNGVLWWLSAEGPPKESCAVWAGVQVLITPVSERQKERQRPGEGKKGKGEGRGEPRPRDSKEADKVEDRLHKADPWAKFMGTAAAASTSMASSPHTANGGLKKMAEQQELTAAPRIASLSSRIDQLEKEQGNITGKVTKIEGQITKMDVSISDQFKQVMEGLAQLQSLQKTGDEKRQRQGS